MKNAEIVGKFFLLEKHGYIFAEDVFQPSKQVFDAWDSKNENYDTVIRSGGFSKIKALNSYNQRVWITVDKEIRKELDKSELNM
jgi:hypothetical protein